MNIKILLTSIFLTLTITFLYGQEEEQKKFSFAVDIKHNSGAGFYPVFFWVTSK